MLRVSSLHSIQDKANAGGETKGDLPHPVLFGFKELFLADNWIPRRLPERPQHQIELASLSNFSRNCYDMRTDESVFDDLVD